MDDIDAAFDDAYRTHRIEAGDDPSTLPNRYSRPSLKDAASPRSNAPAVPASSGSGGGGFIIEDHSASGGGGFMIDDDDALSTGGGGGFMPASDDEAEEEAGQHNPAASSSRATSSINRPNTIPLSAIPDALANLGLNSTDASVLSLFAETAYVPSGSSSRRRLPPGVKPEKVVGRTEFQQVASILVEEQRTSRPTEQDDDHDDADADADAGNRRRRPKRKAAIQGRQKAAEIIGDDERGIDGAGGFMVDDHQEDDDNSEDDFEASRQRRRRRGKATGASSLDTGSDLTTDDDGEDQEFNVDDAVTRTDSRRRRRRPSPSPSMDDGDDDDDEAGSTTAPSKRQRRSTRKDHNTPSIRSTNHLNPLQRENVQTIFSLLLSHLPNSPSSSNFPLTQRRIGTNELTTIIQSIGEKIPPKEVQEMMEEASKLWAPATLNADGSVADRKSQQAIRGSATAQGISVQDSNGSGSASVGLDELAGVLVHNRLI